MQYNDAIARFCGARELFELAQVNQAWRAGVQEIARAVAQFHDALREEPASVIITNSFDRRDRESFGFKGQLSTSDSDVEKICARCVASFTFARMYGIAQYFSKFIVEGKTCKDAVEHAKIMTCIACDLDAIVERGYHANLFGIALCIANEMVIQDTMPCDRISQLLKLAVKSGGYSLPAFVWEIVESTNPSARMTEFLEYVITRDIGYLEYAPTMCGIRAHSVNEGTAIMRNFTGVFATSTRVMLGPIAARAFVVDRRLMCMIARQFSFESPEFELYVQKLNSAMKTAWRYARRGRGTRRDICANLICAARNPDLRILVRVFGMLNEDKFIDSIDGICAFTAWNCGDGFEGLQRCVTRLESYDIRVNFDTETFWITLRLDALAQDEAVRCIDFILARHVDVRHFRASGRAAHAALRFFCVRFGEPLRRVIAAHGIKIDA